MPSNHSASSLARCAYPRKSFMAAHRTVRVKLNLPSAPEPYGCSSFYPHDGDSGHTIRDVSQLKEL